MSRVLKHALRPMMYFSHSEREADIWQSSLARVYTRVLHFYLQPSATMVDTLRA